MKFRIDLRNKEKQNQKREQEREREIEKEINSILIDNQSFFSLFLMII